MNKLIFISIFASVQVIANPYVYLDLEPIYMQRGGSTRKVLVNRSLTDVTTDGLTPFDKSQYKSLITSKNLVHTLGYEPVYRVSIGSNDGAHGGFFRALFSMGWSGQKSAKGPNNLNFPFQNLTYAPAYINASWTQCDYKTNLTLIDGYFTRDFTPLWGQYFAVRGLLGLQYFHIPESAKLTFNNSIMGQDNSYSAQTKNNLALAAVGLMLQIRPTEYLAMELIGYGGAGAAIITSKTDLRTNNDRVSLRSSHRFVGSRSYSFQSTVRAVYRPVQWVQIGLGYELIYAGGVAFPYKQMSYDTNSRSDNRTHHNSSLWFQGVSLRIGFKI